MPAPTPMILAIKRVSLIASLSSRVDRSEVAEESGCLNDRLADAACNEKSGTRYVFISRDRNSIG